MITKATTLALTPKIKRRKDINKKTSNIAEAKKEHKVIIFRYIKLLFNLNNNLSLSKLKIINSLFSYPVKMLFVAQRKKITKRLC